MTTDLIGIFERMATHGTAPEEGCSRFGVGYEDAFRRLRERYILDRFARGGSSDKFVIGPFGSGKTHFLRQLMEMGRDLGCVTSEVMLNKELDFTQNLLVYRKVAAHVRMPGQEGRGLGSLLRACLDKVAGHAAKGEERELLLDGWVAGLEEVPFREPRFGRVVGAALTARREEDDASFGSYLRWLEGYGTDKAVAKTVGETVVTNSETSAFGRGMLSSLFQLIRAARFQGTIVGFDEAEQGLWMDRKKTTRILQQLQADINALSDLDNGSVLVVFAVTPEIVQRMEEFAALQQRVIDPAPGQGFFDGNTLAAKIDLTTDRDPHKDLRAIGRKLVDLYFAEVVPGQPELAREAGRCVDGLAEEVASTEASTSSRRTMTKRTCTLLLNDYYQRNGREQRPAESIQDEEV